MSTCSFFLRVFFGQRQNKIGDHLSCTQVGKLVRLSKRHQKRDGYTSVISRTVRRRRSILKFGRNCLQKSEFLLFESFFQSQHHIFFSGTRRPKIKSSSKILKS
eukprot:Lithocolla_globosa_v1_NODE_4265_length_1476_cov_4.821253.p2 type:complete len:104 gc:universal NODE_4265_length_1476_cov_4.821253:351-40(-)